MVLRKDDEQWQAVWNLYNMRRTSFPMQGRSVIGKCLGNMDYIVMGNFLAVSAMTSFL